MNRSFTILSFIVRNAGNVYRMNREQFDLDSSMDNVPGIIARKSATQVAMGRNVLVTESGSIKPQYSRVNASAIRVLKLSISEFDYLHLVRDVPDFRGVSLDDFKGHVCRSFP
jgi:hypothetical protein